MGLMDTSPKWQTQLLAFKNLVAIGDQKVVLDNEVDQI